MHKYVKRALSLAAVSLMAGSAMLMTACQGNNNVVINEPISLPLEEKATMTWWLAWDNVYAPEYSTLADHPFFQWMEEQTNIHIDFVVPTAKGISDALSEYTSKIASGVLEDMVTHHWFVPELSGSTLDSAVSDGLYTDLTEYVDVQMPNFKQMQQTYAVINKGLYTPEGRIIYIPKLTGVEDNDKAPVTEGLVIRKDMLDELQLDVPVTVDDWTNVLQKLKTQLGVQTPFNIGSMGLAPTVVGDAFITCYGQAFEMYINEDGKLSYGAIEEGTYRYAVMMHDWFQQELVGNTDISREDKLTDNYASWGGYVDEIVNLKNSNPQNPNYNLVAAPYPVLNEGDTLDLRSTYMPVGNKEINSIYVTQDCRNPALACKWIDQFFTEEAFNRASYGVEGEDYTRNEDGTIQFTDKILNDPDGARYGVERNCYLGSMWADRDVLVNYVYGQDAQDAIATWSNATSERNMIRGTSLPMTAEESEAIAGLANFWMMQTGDIRGFITGEKPLTEWEDFVQRMQDGDIAQYIEIYQTAWDRYNAS